MIAVDTNVLVYAFAATTERDLMARAALGQLANSPAAWALPVFCLDEFVRVVTHPRFARRPAPLSLALEFTDRLLASPSCRLLTPGVGYWPLFGRIATAANATGNLVFDARIAALCVEHGARRLLTEDRDFTHFEGIEPIRLEGFTGSKFPTGSADRAE